VVCGVTVQVTVTQCPGAADAQQLPTFRGRGPYAPSLRLDWDLCPLSITNPWMDGPDAAHSHVTVCVCVFSQNSRRAVGGELAVETLCGLALCSLALRCEVENLEGPIKQPEAQRRRPGQGLGEAQEQTSGGRKVSGCEFPRSKTSCSHKA
jgi:hypothetical protein